jgi:membrane-bound lytic murein transglycosylase A
MKVVKHIFIVDFLFLTAFFAMLWTGNGPEKATAAAVVTIPHMAVPGDSVVLADIPAETAEKRQVSSKVLIPAIPDTLPYLSFEPDMLQAMYEQATFLRRKDVPSRGASGITKREMLKTVEMLQRVNLLDPSVLMTTFDFYRINTDLHSDRVRMTGYYTPVVKASRVQTPEYNVPMLRRPESGIPSPAAIEAGAMNGRGLEIAWLASKKELKNAQLQGNCLIEFPDGKREHYGFGGSVKGVGGAYVFFTKVDEQQVMGAGTFPLTARYSVAVDLRYIPLGATLLAELPDLDAAGHLKGYTYRILFAQDRGGGILTTKRLDLYSGVGQKGLQEARKINGHGRLWVLLPKE